MPKDPLEPGKANFSAPSVDREAELLTQATRTRRRAWLLSLGGYIPFAFFAFCLWSFHSEDPLRPLVIDSLKTYGAIILSFLGGTRWGLAMMSGEIEKTRLVLGWSIVPALIGWFSLFLPLPYVFGVQALAFAAQGAWDSFAGQRGVFGLWFTKLRSTLTFLVVGALIVAFFATV